MGVRSKAIQGVPENCIEGRLLHTGPSKEFTRMAFEMHPKDKDVPLPNNHTRSGKGKSTVPSRSMTAENALIA